MTTFMQGFLAAQQAKHRKQNMRMQQAQWQQQMQMRAFQVRALQREEKFQVGKQQAIEQGGMAGMLEYLKNSRPSEFLKVQQQQQSLNNSIQQGEFYKSQKHGSDIKNMQSSQEILGNVYGNIMRLPQDQRQQFYQQSFDMIKKLDPNAPKQFSPQRALFAVSQALPQSQLYQLQQQRGQYKTQLGKLYGDLNIANRAGDKKAAGALQQSIQAIQEKNHQAKLQVSEVELKMQDTNERRAKKLRDEYTKNMKDVQAMAHSYRKIRALSEKDLYNNAAAQISLINAAARLNSPGIVTENDFVQMAKANPQGVVGRLWQSLATVKNGTLLSPSSVVSIRDAAGVQWDSMKPNIKKQKEYYTGLAKKYNIDPSTVITPMFEDLLGDKSKDKGQSSMASEIAPMVKALKEKDSSFNVDDWLDRAKKANPGLDEYLAKNPDYIKVLLKAKMQGGQ